MKKQLTPEQLKDKKIIEKNMLDTVKENPDMASFYSKSSSKGYANSNCKDCYGRGLVQRVFLSRIKTSFGFKTLKSKETHICKCVIKTIKKESEEAVRND